MKKIYTFYLILGKRSENYNYGDFPGVLSDYIIDDGGYKLAFYAYTPEKEIAKFFRKTRNMDIFIENTLVMDEDEYEEYYTDYPDLVLEPHQYTTKKIVDGVIRTDILYLLTTVIESDTVLFYKEEYLAKLFFNSLRDEIVDLITGHVFKNKLEKALNRVLMCDYLLSSVSTPIEDINYDELMVDELSLYIKLFINTFDKDTFKEMNK